MSEREAKTEIAVKAPPETSVLFGHGAAETELLAAYRSGRIAHAWLIGGLKGIGKATLTYRMAKFVLAHPDPAAAEVQTASSLEVDPESQTARLVASGAHGNLLILQRGLNDKGQLRQIITVGEARETLPFFGATAAVGGWRVCVVDSVDELNANGANALLKILEEPPQRSLFLLVSHAPARLLPTIHSRCRKLNLRPLATNDVERALEAATDHTIEKSMLAELAALSDGSVGQAVSLMESRAATLNRRVTAVLDALPRVDAQALHTLGDALPLNDRAALAAFTGGVERWIELRVDAAATSPQPDLPRLARLAEVWEKVGRAARETADYNLERKPLVFSVVNLLAEATA